MDEITDQNQPVSHPVPLTCASCIRAGQREAAGQAIRAKTGPVTHRVSRPGVVAHPAGARSARVGCCILRPVPDLGARPAQQAC